MKKINLSLIIVIANLWLCAALVKLTACTPDSAAKNKGITLQMDFVVSKEKSDSFEKMYVDFYVPAMKPQQGYLGSKLIRLYQEDLAKSIDAEPVAFNYQIQIYFDSEESRKKWVASDQHKIAWPSATALAKEFKWRGYDVIGDDDQR